MMAIRRCRDCAYLDWDHKTSVGYPCLNFNRRRYGKGDVVRTSDMKRASDYACSTGFKAKDKVKKNG